MSARAAGRRGFLVAAFAAGLLAPAAAGALDVGERVVNAARSVICHPIGSPGTCNLVNLMDPAQEADCLSCHDDCLSVTTTTVLPECDLAILPELYSAYSGDRIAFSAESKGKDCIEGVYRWKIESGIGSQISNDGMYTAGMNATGGEVTDTITAEDTANRTESLRYVTVRYEKITAVTPAALCRSYWIAIPHVLIIQGEGTHFSNQDTLVSFDPPSSVHLSWQVVLDDTTIWCFVVVMPAWYAGTKDQTVTATVTTGREVLKKPVLPSAVYPSSLMMIGSPPGNAVSPTPGADSPCR